MLSFQSSVSGFEFTRETGVFDLVGVPLYHGWLVDPQNPCYEVVKDLSYNQLAEKIISDAASQDQRLVEEGVCVCVCIYVCVRVCVRACMLVLMITA